MGKISKRTQRKRLIESSIGKGYSANRIQKTLRLHRLGIRRKTLLAEIRSMKKQKRPSLEKQKLSIRKKYRAKEALPAKAGMPIYRISVIMSDVPIQSKPYARNYLGFRITAFSNNPAFLNSQLPQLREILIKEVEKYIHYRRNDWWFDAEIGIEYATEMYAPPYYSGRWFFRVERQGSEISRDEGYL